MDIFNVPVSGFAYFTVNPCICFNLSPKGNGLPNPRAVVIATFGGINFHVYRHPGRIEVTTVFSCKLKIHITRRCSNKTIRWERAFAEPFIKVT